MAGERQGQRPACVIVIIINLSWGRHNVNNCYTFTLAQEIKKCLGVSVDQECLRWVRCECQWTV